MRMRFLPRSHGYPKTMKILTLTEDSFAQAVGEAAGVLARGGIVLFPTDTLYGLAVDAHNPTAVARLRALKGRETKKPLSIVVNSIEAIEDYAEFPESAREVARAHLPGALTLVLTAKESVPQDIALVGNVGVRVPDHPFSLELARTFGRAYTATSANRSGFATLPHARDIAQSFGPLMAHIDLVIDAGELAGGLGSTVVTFRDGKVCVLREGAISRACLDLP